MDFTFDETQESVRDLAARIFAGRTGDELWSELARSDLLGLCLPEAVGGGGYGMVELCLVLEQQGRVVAPVPLLETVLAALAVAEWGSDELKERWLPRVIGGDAVLSLAVEQHPSIAAGSAPSVPFGEVAEAVVVVGEGGLRLVEPTAREATVLTSRLPAAHLTFDPAGGEPVGDPEWLLDRYRTALAALTLGSCRAALELTAEYTSNRHQFGRPLSTNQGVALRAADAYIDIRAIDVTVWQAAWRLDQGLDARRASLVAKWWASEAGQRVVHATQHLHGGMGADVEYPVHRYYLWSKTIELQLGGPGRQLAALGAELAHRDREVTAR